MQTLLITATDTSVRDDGVVPTRFITDIVTAMPQVEITHTSGRPKRPLSPEGLIANLRRTLSSPETSEALKLAAANQLAQLLQIDGTVFFHANPDKWWGVLEQTENLRPVNAQVSISASGITAIEHCPAQWFLERKLNALSQSATPMIFGNALHAIAQGLSAGDLAYDISAIDDQLDRLWPGMGYEAAWESSRERTAAHDASVRLLTWMLEHKDQMSITESALSWKTKVDVENSDGSSREVDIAITGRADRIEFTENGIMVFDFKTSKEAKKTKELFKDVQLALYTYLLEHGNYTKDEVAVTREPSQEVKGAALVQLRVGEQDNSDLAMVQQVSPETHDENSPVTLTQRLGKAALVVLDERYEARYEDQKCKLCKVRMLCPATPEGKQVLS
jgi:RecB family exonuclease